MQIKHIGRGMFSAIDADGNRVGPVGRRDEVDAWMKAAGQPEPAPAAAVVIGTESTPIDQRAYAAILRKSRASLAAPVMDELRGVLSKHFDGYILDRVMRRIEPIVKNPKRRHKAI